MSKTTTIILVIVGCVLLAVANLALWAATDIFNAGRFGDHVAAGLQSPEAAAALAEPMVDRLMESYPELPAIAKVPAVEAVTWLIQRPAFTKVFKSFAFAAMKVMTTSAQDVVGIDIAEVAENAGSTVVGIITAVDSDAGAQAQAALDEAVATAEESGPLSIYENGRFPNLRQASNTAPWVGILTLLGAIALFIISYLRFAEKHSALKYIGVGLIVTAVVGFLLVAPLVQGVAQNNIADPNMQIVVGEVLTSLLRAYALQSLLIAGIGAVVLIVNHARDQEAVSETVDVVAEVIEEPVEDSGNES